VNRQRVLCDTFSTATSLAESHLTWRFFGGKVRQLAALAVPTHAKRQPTSQQIEGRRQGPFRSAGLDRDKKDEEKGSIGVGWMYNSG
jgi:hypothetical protein